MFEFSNEEKDSIRYFIKLNLRHYSSNAILDRIDRNKLTKKDLAALDSKVRVAMGSFRTPGTDIKTMFEIGYHSSIILNALSRYRSDDYDSEKLIDEYFKRKSVGVGKGVIGNTNHFDDDNEEISGLFTGE